MERFTGPAEQPANPERIEAELKRLFSQLDDVGEGGPRVMRAAAWNLIVPCDLAPAEGEKAPSPPFPAVNESEEVAREAIVELVETHPARVLFLVAEEGAGDTLTASVAALCHRPGEERRQVCCELIRLRARGAPARHLPDAARSLLLPDLPVAVWRPGRRKSARTSSGALAPLDEALASLADRWIVDTAVEPDGEALQQTEALLSSRPGLPHGVVVDLAWLRLLPWRELTAQFFDPPAFRSRLGALDCLEVWVAPGASTDAVARLWIAWLAARLGWQLTGAAGRNAWCFSRPNGTGLARLSHDPPPDLPGGNALVGPEASVSPTIGPLLRRAGSTGPEPPRPGAMRAVRLSASDPDTSFTIAHDPRTGCATLVVATTGACPLPRTVRFEQPGLARLLAAALDEPRPDPLYPEALALAARL